MLAGARFANLPGVVTLYRKHDGQSSNDIETMLTGVTDAKTRLLLVWFPDLSFNEVRSLEPLLRAYGKVYLDLESAGRGVAALRKALAAPQVSLHGEDRSRVRQFLEERLHIWQGHLDLQT